MVCKEYIYAGIAIFFWSTVATVSKLLMNELNNIQLLWCSSLFAGVALLIVNLVTGNIKTLKKYKFKDLVIIALIGLPGVFLYYVFYYGGTALMPASQAFIINYLWPILSVVFACILLKEKMTIRKGIAIVMSFLGVVIVTCGDLTEFGGNMLLGTALCVCAAVSYGFFTAINKKMHYDKRISMMINYAVTFVLTTIINAVNHDLFAPNLVQTLGFAWNGVFTMAVASTLWVVALDLGKTEKISNLAYITPFLSLVWTSLILKEPFRLVNILGLAVIVAGILIQFQRTKKEKV